MVKNTAQKETDNWQTPKWLMKVFSEFYDPVPPNYDKDYMSTDVADKRQIYINPPYSNPLPFVLKAIEDHKKCPNNVIVLLLKFDSTTKWYKALVDAEAHFLYCAERLHYSESGAAPFSSVLAILSD